MRRPSPAILGSIALHVGVLALALVSWPKEPLPTVPSSVPVSIVSSEVVAAAARSVVRVALVATNGADAYFVGHGSGIAHIQSSRNDL